MTNRPRWPTPEQVAAARDGQVPDLIGAGLKVLFCGINPSLYSAAVGHHFARPGNRFWPALAAGGFTPRRLAPSEGEEMLRLGLGITNVVPRATVSAAEVTPDEFIEGGRMLARKVARFRPSVVAFWGSPPIVPRSGGPGRWSGSRKIIWKRRRSGSCPTRAA